MAIVEDDAHGIIAHRLQAADLHILLAGDGGGFWPPWPRTSALGDSTRNFSAPSVASRAIVEHDGERDPVPD